MANVVTVEVSSLDTVYPGATIDVNLAHVQQIWPTVPRSALDDRDCIFRFANGEQLRVKGSAFTRGYVSARGNRVGSFERYEFAGTVDDYKPRVRWVNLDLVRWVRPTAQPGVFEITWAMGGDTLLVHKVA